MDVEALTRNQEVRNLGAGEDERCQGVAAILNQAVGATLGCRGVVAVGEGRGGVYHLDVTLEVGIKLRHKVDNGTAELLLECFVLLATATHGGVGPACALLEGHGDKQADNIGVLVARVGLHAHQYARDVDTLVHALQAPHIVDVEVEVVVVLVLHGVGLHKEVCGEDAVGVSQRVHACEEGLLVDGVVLEHRECRRGVDRGDDLVAVDSLARCELHILRLVTLEVNLRHAGVEAHLATVALNLAHHKVGKLL